MRIETYKMDQGSAEWLLARAGAPTASCFKHLLAKGRGGEESKTRRAYLYRLADEAVYGDPVESEYTNENMENGKIREAEARSIYALENDVVPEQVGFIFNHTIGAGCSPDSLIGDNGVLEIKTSFPRLWLPYMMNDQFPPEYVAQCQGELLVSCREWVDLMVYWPKRRPYIKRAYRDEAYLRDLEKALRTFNEELSAIVDAMRTKLDLVGTLKKAAAQ